MGIRAGLWGSDMSKSSSNHRKFWNLVEYVEDAVINSQLTNAEVFFLWKVRHWEHLLETHILEQDTISDSLETLKNRNGRNLKDTSHSCFWYAYDFTLIKEGSISGEYIMSFLPLHLSALKCSDKLLEWIKSWWEKGNEVPLTPEYWLKKGKGKELLVSLPNKKGTIYLLPSNRVYLYVY